MTNTALSLVVNNDATVDVESTSEPIAVYVGYLTTIPSDINPSVIGATKQCALYNQKGERISQSQDSFTLVRMVADASATKHHLIFKAGITECEVVDYTFIQKLRGSNRVLAMPVASARAPQTLTNVVSQAVAPQFSVHERYDFARSLVQMVGQRSLRGVFITGNKGTGKSTLVESVLQSLNLVNQLENGGTGDYRTLSGSTSASRLYALLFSFRHEGLILVLDDVNIADEETRLLIMAATDTKPKRTIAWNKNFAMTVTEKDEEGVDKQVEVPSQFEFRGSVIIITNQNEEKIKELYGQRLPTVNLWMTNPEIFEYMEIEVAPKMMEQYSEEVVTDALNCLREFYMDLQHLNLRLFTHIINFRANNAPNWQKLARSMAS